MTKKKVYLRDGRAPMPRSDVISRIMSANKGKNTSPEVIMRKLLRLFGWRHYRLHPRSIIGKPDAAFPRNKIAIFLDGCFWHGCPRCFVTPKTHRTFWMKKIRTNKLRDRKIDKKLRARGWTSIRIWEHQLDELVNLGSKR